MKKTKIGLSVNVYRRMVREKVTTVVLALSVVMAATCLIGCGNSKVDVAAEQYEKELGMSKEEAKEYAEFFYGEEQETEDEEVKVNLIDATPEIKNSKITDPLVQVQGAVIPTNGNMTIGEAKEAISKTCDFNLLIKSEQSEQTADALIEPFKIINCSIENENGDVLAQFGVVNDNENSNKFYDAKVVTASAESSSVESLNFFYAGNICAGIYPLLGDMKETKAYKERLKEYQPLTNDDVTDFLKSQGLNNIPFVDDIYLTGYWIEILSNIPCYKCDQGEDMYAYTRMYIAIDKSNASVTNIGKNVAFSTLGTYAYNITSLDGLTADDYETIRQAGVEELTDEFTDKADADAKLIAVWNHDPSDKDFNFIFLTDRDEYVTVTILLHRNFGGTVGTSEVDTNCYSDPKSSLEECLEYEGITMNDITMIQ